MLHLRPLRITSLSNLSRLHLLPLVSFPRSIGTRKNHSSFVVAGRTCRILHARSRSMGSPHTLLRFLAVLLQRLDIFAIPLEIHRHLSIPMAIRQFKAHLERELWYLGAFSATKV